MTSLTKHQSADTTKMLLIGASGAGKTSSIASLVMDGYKVFFLDFDNGMDVLVRVLAEKAPDKIAGVQYKTLADDVEFRGSGLVVKSARAFQEGMKSLSKWTDDDGTDLGSIWTWGPDVVLVIDNLTRVGRFAMNQTLSLNNRLMTGPQQSDWGKAQDEVENLLAMLYAPSVKCNVIVLSHIIGIEDDSGVSRSQPMTLGKALSPKVPTYFNTMLLAKTSGMGKSTKRVIRTVPDGTVGVKHPILSGLPEELPNESGLATFFRMLRDKKTVAVTSKVA